MAESDDIERYRVGGCHGWCVVHYEGDEYIDYVNVTAERRGLRVSGHTIPWEEVDAARAALLVSTPGE